MGNGFQLGGWNDKKGRRNPQVPPLKKVGIFQIHLTLNPSLEWGVNVISSRGLGTGWEIHKQRRNNNPL